MVALMDPVVMEEMVVDTESMTPSPAEMPPPPHLPLRTLLASALAMYPPSAVLFPTRQFA